MSYEPDYHWPEFTPQQAARIRRELTAIHRAWIRDSGLRTVGDSVSVTQLTSKSTDVTVNSLVGEITLHDASLAAGAIVRFFLNNTQLDSGDLLYVQRISGGTGGAYNVWCDSMSPTLHRCFINVKNETAGALAESPVLRFFVIKGA